MPIVAKQGKTIMPKSEELPTKEIFSWTEGEYHSYDDEMIGFCIHCKEERGSTEPDACEYPCESCETDTVYGAAELLMMGLVNIS